MLAMSQLTLWTKMTTQTENDLIEFTNQSDLVLSCSLALLKSLP